MIILVLIGGTIRELAAKATLYVLAGISTLILLVVLLGVSSSSIDSGGTSIMFFGNPISPPGTAEQLADFASKIEAGLASGLFLGIVLFGVFATAGIVPDALEKGTVDLYLSKPISRLELLLGKFLGGAVVIFLNIAFFIGCLWAIVGVKLGVWNLPFLISSVSMSFVFACLFAIVVFFGVLSRNMAIAIISGFTYLFIIAELLQNRENGLFRLSENTVYRSAIDALYYALPQIPGMQRNMANFIIGQDVVWQPFLQSFLSAVAILGLSVVLLRSKDF
jgi:ABC-type transport system involved in multi-copper enzyme maturation permease subunit